MKVPFLTVWMLISLYLTACNNCDDYETSNTSITLTMDTTLLIDSIAFRGTGTLLRPHSNSVEITLNPYADTSYYDIYINGTRKFLGLLCKRDMVYDCHMYFTEYRIDSIIHNFNHARYKPVHEGPSLIILK